MFVIARQGDNLRDICTLNCCVTVNTNQESSSAPRNVCQKNFNKSIKNKRTRERKRVKEREKERPKG